MIRSLAKPQYIFIVLAVLLALPRVGIGQGFNTTNNRNHPELDWQVAETEHFKIMYPAHLAGIEIEAATIAEASYKALSENLDTQIDKKIRIYLSDEDEILNGFATRLNYTMIWVHVNDVSRQWSGHTKWLRTVIPHELAHLFHGKAVRGNRSLLIDYLYGDPMPSFWTEGIAQYETELWDAYRGEQWLRTATLDDRLSYNDGRSLWNGRLLYAVGNSQVRYLASQYGDSTLPQILQHRDTTLLGLVQTHDFYSAFDEVVEKPYESFYDEWRRHINIYYNTLAGQMENTDSLETDPFAAPGQYLYDLQFNPDTTRLAVLSLTSLSRPVRRLYVIDKIKKTTTILADGAIQPPFAWHPDGSSIAFARRTRTKTGSIINDLFTVDTKRKKVKRLTHGRRAVSPSYAPDGKKLAFIASANGTGNIYMLDLQTGKEEALTNFQGDVQLSYLKWEPNGNRIAFSIFDSDGVRDIRVLDLATGDIKKISKTAREDQYPVWSPDGTSIAYTSLRDQVPNVFVHDLVTDSTHRITRIVTGATVHQWVSPDSLHPGGSLLITAGASKQRDRAFRIPASRRVVQPKITVPETYKSWTSHRPPAQIPRHLAPNEQLVTNRYSYKPAQNLVHASSVALPYYNNEEDWGLFGFTSWFEPLGKHNLGFLAGIAIPDVANNSFGLLTYVNNQLRPTLTLNAYKIMPAAVAYGNEYAIEEKDGGDIAISWPVDSWARPYTSTRINLQGLYYATSLFNDNDYDPLPAGLAPPQNGEEFGLQLTFTRKTLRPYRNNIIHPLDGAGLQLRIKAGLNLLGGDTEYIQGSLRTYKVLRMPGLHRLYVYGKAEILSGTAFNQDRPGFARFDDIQVTAPILGVIAFSDTDRVRGFRQFAYGNRLLFGSAEYRMPFLPSLQTELLGLISLGSTTLSLFADAGGVWDNSDVIARRLGLGAEIKNTLTIGGMLQIMHAVGIAQPAPEIGTPDNYDLYYRVRTTLPF